METSERKQKETQLIENYHPVWNSEYSTSISVGEIQNIQSKEVSNHQSSIQTERSTNQDQSLNGKYSPLYDNLEKADTKTLDLTFNEVEDILNSPLPPSAKNHKEWWNPTGHSHAEGWANLGWSAESDLEEGVVNFRKTQ